MKNKRAGFFQANLFAAFFLLLSLSGVSLTGGSAVAEGDARTKSYAEFNQSVTETIAVERTSISQRKERADQLQASLEALKADINSYRLQLSAHGNLLLSPTFEIDPLEKAATLNRSSLDRVKKQTREIGQQLEALTRENVKNEEQLRLNNDQLAQFKAQRSSVPEATALINNIKELIRILTEKQKYLADLTDKSTKQKEALEEIEKGFTTLAGEFERQIQIRKKQLLFQRGDSPLRITQWLQLSAEIDQVRRKLTQISSIPFWQDELNEIWELEGLHLFTFTILFIIMMVVFIRIKRYARTLIDRPVYRNHPWRLLSFQVFTDSLPLLGITIFLSLFVSVRKVNTQSLIFPLLYLLIVLLFTRWCRNALSNIVKMPLSPIPKPYANRVKSLIGAVRLFAVIYALTDWMIEGTSFFLFILRAFLEVGLLLWGLSIRKQIEQHGDTDGNGVKTDKKPLRPALALPGYFIFGIGPLLELSGFGEFAWYWYRSWGNTVIVFLWGAILFLVLREWDQPFAVSDDQDDDVAAASAQPVRWIIFRLCWLLWAVLFVLALLFAWGARQQVLSGLLQALRYPIEVGQMQLSLMGFIYAFLLLFFTHLIVKTVRYILKKKFLIQSGFERGLQESITNITVYILWGLGILISLHAVGVNTASMAVVLGALGIGLGFGLQNIFNNFISGIILLFERPIQAGDDIEINGLWATVQKINVRATVVQTYDNAAIIIPNSEFISSQVTNWSFKDRRLRRKISIGVAYGSDTALVRRSLLEIAANTPKVLKRPAPDVVFSDFADSALIFILRFWTTVDQFLKTESDIRYEIDHLFKERNISIAFPQRDVHIYNMDAKQPVENTPVYKD